MNPRLRVGLVFPRWKRDYRSAGRLGKGKRERMCIDRRPGVHVKSPKHGWHALRNEGRGVLGYKLAIHALRSSGRATQIRASIQTRQTPSRPAVANQISSPWPGASSSANWMHATAPLASRTRPSRSPISSAIKSLDIRRVPDPSHFGGQPLLGPLQQRRKISTRREIGQLGNLVVALDRFRDDVGRLAAADQWTGGDVRRIEGPLDELLHQPPKPLAAVVGQRAKSIVGVLRIA